MGGKKKRSLSKTVKRQTRKGRERKERESGGSTAKKKTLGIMPPDPRSKKVIGELKKLSYLTPYVVASRFDLRLSAAKVLLEELEKRGIIDYVSGGRNLKIYQPRVS